MTNKESNNCKICQFEGGHHSPKCPQYKESNWERRATVGEPPVRILNDYNWNEELMELSEKYCKHDDREMNSCLYWIFRLVILKALKAKDKAFIKDLKGLEMEEKHFRAMCKHGCVCEMIEYNQAVQEFNDKIKQIKKKYEQ